MTEPRSFIMARPSIIVADCIQARLQWHGVAGELGDGAFDRANWHQSLSDRYWPGRIGALDTELQRALGVLVAYPATLRLDRIVRRDGFCLIEADGTKDFRALLLAIKRALAPQGLSSRASNEPHVSLSYWGSIQGSTIMAEPIDG